MHFRAGGASPLCEHSEGRGIAAALFYIGDFVFCGLASARLRSRSVAFPVAPRTLTPQARPSSLRSEASFTMTDEKDRGAIRRFAFQERMKTGGSGQMGSVGQVVPLLQA